MRHSKLLRYRQLTWGGGGGLNGRVHGMVPFGKLFSQQVEARC